MMMKLFLGLILVLFVSQGSSGKSVIEDDLFFNLDDATGLISELDAKLKDMIPKVSREFQQLTQDYTNQLQTTINSIQINKVIDDTNLKILGIIAKGGPNMTECSSKSWQEMIAITQDSKAGTDLIVREAQEYLPQVQKITDAFIYGIKTFISSLGQLLVTCMNENQGDVDKSADCIVARMKLYNEQYEQLDNDIEDIKQQATLDSSKYIKRCEDNLNILKIRIVKKTGVIISSLEECVGLTGQVETIDRQSRIYFYNIMDDLSALIAKVKQLLSDINDEILNMPRWLTDKINSIVSQLNLQLIKTQMKNEVKGMIDEAGLTDDKCSKEANGKIDAIIEESQNKSSECLHTAQDRLSEFKTIVDSLNKNLTAEVMKVKTEIEQKILGCKNANRWNVQQFFNCLLEYKDMFNQTVQRLQDKVQSSISETTDLTKNITETMMVCVNNIQLDCIKKGQTIMEETKKCIVMS